MAYGEVSNHSGFSPSTSEVGSSPASGQGILSGKRKYLEPTLNALQKYQQESLRAMGMPVSAEMRTAADAEETEACMSEEDFKRLIGCSRRKFLVTAGAILGLASTGVTYGLRDRTDEELAEILEKHSPFDFPPLVEPIDLRNKTEAWPIHTNGRQRVWGDPQIVQWTIEDPGRMQMDEKTGEEKFVSDPNGDKLLRKYLASPGIVIPVYRRGEFFVFMQYGGVGSLYPEGHEEGAVSPDEEEKQYVSFWSEKERALRRSIEDRGKFLGEGCEFDYEELAVEGKKYNALLNACNPEDLEAIKRGVLQAVGSFNDLQAVYDRGDRYSQEKFDELMKKRLGESHVQRLHGTYTGDHNYDNHPLSYKSIKEGMYDAQGYTPRSTLPPISIVISEILFKQFGDTYDVLSYIPDYYRNLVLGEKEEGEDEDLNATIEDVGNRLLCFRLPNPAGHAEVQTL
jgi:hypothetical protein